MPDWLAGALIAFGIATLSTPAGISGAVFLLPVQVSILNVANPALSPTNLLYNVLATPGGLLRFAQEGRVRTPLTRALLVGSMPGIVVGSVIRVELLAGRKAILLVVAAVLMPLGAWLLRTYAGPRALAPPVRDPMQPGRWIPWTAALVGVVGGIYGIGGGSLLAPILVAAGYPLATIAPAALAATFLTSVVGVVSFQALSLIHGAGTIAPVWLLGLALGVGGLLGSYTGAALQPRVPERALRALLGLACIAIAALYLTEAL